MDSSNNTLARNCPLCNKEIIYTTKRSFTRAGKNNTKCASCAITGERNGFYGKKHSQETINKIKQVDRSHLKKKETNQVWERKCPICETLKTYSTYGAYKLAEKNNSKCRKCVAIVTGFIDKYATSGKNTGINNSFYGKNHTDVSRAKMRTKIKRTDHSKWQTPEFRAKMSKLVSGRKDKSVYSIWVRKYGEERANQLKEEWIAKKRINSSGSRNPMYGKPTPQGAGNGWSGWYNNWFFRSLRELSYMINVIERTGLQWQTADTKDLRIPYVDYKGSDRTYSADFLIDERILVEIKPQKLHVSPTVMAKKKAAELFCQAKGLYYNIVDVEPLSDQEIKKLHDCGKLKFTERYEKLYEQRVINLRSTI